MKQILFLFSLVYLGWATTFVVDSTPHVSQSNEPMNLYYYQVNVPDEVYTQYLMENAILEEILAELYLELDVSFDQGNNPFLSLDPSFNPASMPGTDMFQVDLSHLNMNEPSRTNVKIPLFSSGSTPEDWQVMYQESLQMDGSTSGFIMTSGTIHDLSASCHMHDDNQYQLDPTFSLWALDLGDENPSLMNQEEEEEEEEKEKEYQEEEKIKEMEAQFEQPKHTKHHDDEKHGKKHRKHEAFTVSFTQWIFLFLLFFFFFSLMRACCVARRRKGCNRTIQEEMEFVEEEPLVRLPTPTWKGTTLVQPVCVNSEGEYHPLATAPPNVGLGGMPISPQDFLSK